MSSIRIVQTSDGSHTLYSELHKAHYHSTNGAIQESQHIFIKNGFELISQNEISVLEIGFGSGLNAALTASSAQRMKTKTSYTGIDLYPHDLETLHNLNYKTLLKENDASMWAKVMAVEWEETQQVNDFFWLKKVQDNFTTIEFADAYDLIYFDAFAPDDQPDMWTDRMFNKLYKATKSKGILVTYCSKGIVKQALRNNGYIVERLPGPPGKRHIIKATKE